jgi:hypothetical protein
MPQSLQDIRTSVEQALKDNEAERGQLDKALLYLDMGITPSVGSPIRPKLKAAKPKRRRVKRAPKGQRKAQFLDAVKGKPEITVGEIARNLGISPPNSLYALAKRLVKEGKVVKSGAGYKLKTPTPKKAAPKAAAAKKRAPKKAKAAKPKKG